MAYRLSSGFLCVFGISAVLLLVATVAHAGTDDRTSDQRFLEGLRQRRLFELARTYCVERLDDSSLPSPRRAELTIELSLSLAEWALNSPPGEREPLWRDAWQVTEDFLQQYPDSPRAVLVRLQGALGLLARGELARQEAQVAADNNRLLEEARTWLREAIGMLQELDERLAAAIREQSRLGRAARAQGAPEPLGTSELTSVQRNVQYELARALRNQGQSYPTNSPDRANSLTQAIKLLDPLTKLDDEYPLTWKSRIDELVCLRLLGDCAGARRNLDTLLASDPPAQVLLRGRAEKIRLALGESQLSDALAVIALGREIGGVTSGDLDYAWVEAYLAAWRAAIDAEDGASAKHWQAKAAGTVSRIEQEQGPYWTRRAELLLARCARTAPGGGNLDMQIRAAASSYRMGRLDEALAAYDRARAVAEAKGDRARAFELGYVAAAIEHRRDRHAEALRRYRQLALDMPSQPRAPEAHSLAIYHAAQLVKNQQGSLNKYTELLEEHLRLWPEAAGADQFRWRLGQLREHQQDWQRAVNAYREVSPDDAKFIDAVEAVGRCYRTWLDQRRAAGQPTDEIASEASTWLGSLVVGPDNRLPERWSPAARTAALEAARLRLADTPTGSVAAERLLTAALQDAPDAPAEWKTAARCLLVSALAAQGRRQEAMAIIEQISAGSPGDWSNLLEELSRIAADAGPDLRADLAQLRLTAIERLNGSRQGFPPDDSRTIELARAQALADAGRTGEARDAFERLSAAHPRDGKVQEAYALLLSAGQGRATLEKALEKWREIEAKTPARSDRWFRAKFHVAQLQYRLGNSQQAAKMIQLLKLLYPDLGGPERKRQFLELLAQATERPD